MLVLPFKVVVGLGSAVNVNDMSGGLAVSPPSTSLAPKLNQYPGVRGGSIPASSIGPCVVVSMSSMST